MAIKTLSLITIILTLITILISFSSPAFPATDEEIISQMEQDLRTHADEVEDEYIQIKIACYFLNKGEVEFAMRLAEKIDSSYHRHYFLSSLENEYKRTKDTVLQKLLISKVIHDYQEIEDSYDKVRYLQLLARHAFAVNDSTFNDSLVSFIINGVNNLEEPNDRSVVYLDIALSSLKQNRYDLGAKYLAASLDQIKQIENPYDTKIDTPRSRATWGFNGYLDSWIEKRLLLIAQASIELDSKSKTNSLIAETILCIEKVKLPNPGLRWYSYLVQKLTDIFHKYFPPENAQILSDQVYLECMMFPMYSTRRITLDSIVSFKTVQGDLKPIASFLSMAINKTDDISKPIRKTLLLNSINYMISRFYTESPDLGDSLIIEVLKKAQTLNNSYHKAYTLYEIANTYVQRGNKLTGDSILQLAIKPAENIADQYVKADFYKLLTIVSLNCGNETRADSLLHLTLATTIKIDGETSDIDKEHILSGILSVASYLNHTENILDHVFDAMRTIHNSHNKSIVLDYAIKNYLPSPDSTRSGALLKKILAELNEFKTPIEQAYSFITNSECFTEAGYSDIGDSLLHLATLAAPNIVDPFARAKANTLIARKMISRGKNELGFSLLRTAIEAYREIKYEFPDDYLRLLIEQIISLKNTEQVDSLLEIAFKVIEQQNDPEFTHAVMKPMLRQIGNLEGYSRQKEIISLIFNKAEQIIDMELKYCIVSSVINRIDFFCEDKDCSRTLEFFDNAIEHISDPYCKSDYFIKCANFWDNQNYKERSEESLRMAYKYGVAIKDIEKKDDRLFMLASTSSMLGEFNLACDAIKGITSIEKRLWAICFTIADYHSKD